MSLYVDSSALLKRYVEEPDSELAERLLASDTDLITGRHALVEIRRNLARLLDAAALGEVRAAALGEVRAAFAADVVRLSVVELDPEACERAASAEITGVRTLDALHLGAAQRAGGSAAAFLTFDLRQAQAARALGMTVLGA